MIVTSEKDTTINFKKLDEWVVVMIINQPCPGGGMCLSRIKFTMNSLLDEISRLKQEEPKQT